MFRIIELTALNEMSIFNYFKKLGPDQTSQVLNKSSTSLSSRETEEVRKKLIEKESEGGKRNTEYGQGKNEQKLEDLLASMEMPLL